MAAAPTPAARPLVLGIDPGLRACGWGLVRAGAQPEFVATGVLRPPPRDPIATRLLFLHDAIAGLIATHRPDEAAIEDPFVGAVAPASALAIGQARAAALLAAAAAGIEVALYTPTAVKAAVTGYGRGDKAQVQAMVRLLLRLDEPPAPFDAADALAVALCHLAGRRTAALTAPPQRTRASR